MKKFYDPWNFYNSCSKHCRYYSSNRRPGVLSICLQFFHAPLALRRCQLDSSTKTPNLRYLRILDTGRIRLSLGWVKGTSYYLLTSHFTKKLSQASQKTSPHLLHPAKQASQRTALQRLHASLQAVQTTWAETGMRSVSYMLPHADTAINFSNSLR